MAMVPFFNRLVIERWIGKWTRKNLAKFSKINQLIFMLELQPSLLSQKSHD